MTKKLFIKFLFLAPIPLIIAAVNYSIDPLNRFHTGEYERKMAHTLLMGKSVGNGGDFNQWLMQKFYIAGLPERKNVALFGSSLIGAVGSDVFQGMSFVNNYMSQATLEDYLFLYFLYKQRNLMPHIIILELSPWLLNEKNVSASRQQSFLREYKKAAAFFDAENAAHSSFLFAYAALREYAAVLSPSYFQVSFDMRLRGEHRRYISEENWEAATMKQQRTIRTPDGNMVYGELFCGPYADGTMAAKEFATREDVIYLENFSELDKERIRLFENFITRLKADNVIPIFYMPPYHPEAYNILMRREQYGTVIAASEKYFKKLAHDIGINIFGSYNPQGLFKAADFCDEAHIRMEPLTSFFRNLIQNYL